MRRKRSSGFHCQVKPALRALLNWCHNLQYLSNNKEILEREWVCKYFRGKDLRNATKTLCSFSSCYVCEVFLKAMKWHLAPISLNEVNLSPRVYWGKIRKRFRWESCHFTWLFSMCRSVIKPRDVLHQTLAWLFKWLSARVRKYC